ncbi:TAXI family TRAP transporter solute-binding subunit [Actinokineospora iranica]|uniref:TRAP transporter solute receptor, TAXI family n=1 Tax=Actinokineospora iranica TaxID=1271860 RepID=A0A1G6S071_9PSEU|nr:TAXI family TRAP transporter solute-binding subunit [Actinokineospora iranica]SDD10061.1 hypothetical protein SAMN05216174_107127 [Actinokineospora iranica]
MSLSRRGFLVAAALVGAGCGAGGPEGAVRVAAGEPGGFYVEFAGLLAAEITRAEPGLRAGVVETAGSVQNLQRVSDGHADLALTLADALDVARSGGKPFRAALPLRALGRVYENYMQVVVRADSPVRALGDLAGHRISLGAAGSGAALFGSRLLATAGVAVVADHRPLAEAARALRDGRVEALLWSGGVPTPALADLDAAVGIRLLDLGGQVAGLRAAHGAVYDQVVVPEGTYRSTADTMTVGVANLLVPSPTLPDDVVRAVVRVLATRADRLVPQQAVGTQYLDVRALIDTGSAPLHPAAAETYRDLHG